MKVTTLTPTDLQFVVARLPKDIRELAKKHNIIIAGGFVRETIASGEVKDIDIFGESKDLLRAAANDLEIERNAATQSANMRKFETDNAITLLSPPRLPVQFITRWVFKDPKLCLESLDFTVCQAAVWMDRGGQWNSLCSESFYPDLAARRLVYTFPQREEEAGGSMLRVRKFLQRGYNIQAGSLGGVMSRLMGAVDKKGKDCMEAHEGGERGVAKILTGLLREVDPMTLIDGVELVDEHEIVS